MAPSARNDAARSATAFRCLEVWGGNRAADLGVSMPAIDACVLAEPFGAAEDEQGDRLAGGDVHFLSSCGTGRIVRVVVADVSGHGPTVARIAETLRRLMRRHMNELRQTRFVTALNRAFAAEAEGGEQGRFATSIAMTFFSPTGRLDLCNAGHPRPLCWRARERRWSLLRMPEPDRRVADRDGEALSNLPLGIHAPTRYEEFSVALGRDDLVLAYTDAAIESRDSEGRMLGERGLLELVASLPMEDPTLLPRRLRDRLVERSGAIDDDLTILLLRCTQRRAQAPFVARLWAGLRFLGLLGRALVPGSRRSPVPWPELSIPNTLGAIMPSLARRWSVREPEGER